MEISQEMSRRITAYRWMGILFVVLCHSFQSFFYSPRAIVKLLAYDLDFPSAFDFLFSVSVYGVGFGAVPVFFLISGYLQLYRETPYVELLKKRSRNLLLPMLLWTIIAVIEYLLFYPLVGEVASFNFLHSTDPKVWFSLLVGNYSMAWINGTHCPMMYQFWFIRDLFVLSVMTPLLRAMMEDKQHVVLYSFMFGLILVYGYRPVVCGSDALFYYFIGGICAKYHFDFFKLVDKYWSWPVAIGSCLLTSVQMYHVHNAEIYATALNQASSALLLIRISGVIDRTPKLFRLAECLSGQSFFLYAAHGHFLMTLLFYISVTLFPIATMLGCIAAVSFTFFGVLSICTYTGILLNRYFPRVFAFLTGGRMRKSATKAA